MEILFSGDFGVEFLVAFGVVFLVFFGFWCRVLGFGCFVGGVVVGARE